jgi:site-specific recombinase XerC
MSTLRSSDVGDTLMGYIVQMEHRLSERTKLEYAARLKELSGKIQRRIDHVTVLTPDMLIDQIKRDMSHGIADSTFRLNRAAVLYWIGQQAQALIASGEDSSDYVAGFNALKALRYVQANDVQRTASRKLKFFPQECFAALLKYANERGSRAPNAARAIAFVKANLLVGLRPVEWFSASLASYLVRNEDGDLVRDARGQLMFEPMLIVRNAKATHGRGNGQFRELILYGITADELTSLMNFVEIAQRFRDRHSANIESKELTNLLYRPLNNLIHRALTNAGFAQRDIPSCYSTRHQVVADHKASGRDKRTIAAFFGHSSMSTHQEHYGRKKHGSRPVTFAPSAESLSQVTTRRNVARGPDSLSPQLVQRAQEWIAERASRRD